MHNYKDLKVWQKARKLVKKIYLLLNDFPNEEIYGLTSQIKRAVISIPSNIAEGSGRKTIKDFYKFFDIANASAFELETQIILASDLDFLSEDQKNDLLADIIEIQKMIFGLKKTL